MLCGAHRTGKTTLAKAFSDQSGMPFVQTGASHVFADMGLDPKVDYPLDVRLEIQKRILDSFEKQCSSLRTKHFITDRTPVDFMAYTMADIQRENVRGQLEKDIEKYLVDCADVSNSLFSILVVLQPGIPLVEAEGKAPANVPYIEHISHLIMGIVVSEVVQSAHFYIPRHITSLEDRIACVSSALALAGEKHERFKKDMDKSGHAIVVH
jgi:hypothetical protein